MPISILLCSSLFASEKTDSDDHPKGSVENRVVRAQDMLLLRVLGGAAEEGLSVSPDGTTIAFQMHRANLEGNTYRVGWYVLDLTKEIEPVLIAEAGDPLLFRAKVGPRINGAWQSTNPVWSPDSRWFAYRRMEGESVQVWRSNVDGSTQEQLTTSDISVDAFYWSDDGQQIWFETDAAPEEQEEYIQSKWENGLWGDDEHFQPRSNSYRLLPYTANSGQPLLWVLDLSSRLTRPATEHEIQSHFEANSVSLHRTFGRADRSMRVPGRPHSRSVVASQDKERLAWIESSRTSSGGTLRARLLRSSDLDFLCEFEECLGYISKLWWSRDGQEVVFRRSGQGPDRGRIFFYAWHIDNNTVRKIYAGNSRYLSACSSTGHSLVCFSDEPASPRTLVELQFADGSIRELFDPNPKFDEFLSGEVERIVWENEFGGDAFGWIIKPAGYEKGRRYPLVILQYQAKDCFVGGTGAEYPSQLFAAEGFVVLCSQAPTFRKPAESAEWKDTYNYYLVRRQTAASLESAIELLDKNGLIDPSQVGVTGLSAGADTISYALSHSNKYSAAISAGLEWAPINYYLMDASTRARASKLGLGRPGTAEDKFWAEMSLGLNTSKVTTPILIQVSSDEALGARYEYVTLKEEGKAIDMYVFKDEYHVKWHPKNRKAVAERAVDWMRFWLKGEEDSDHNRPDQFERWRTLCQQHIANLSASEDPDLQRRSENQPCRQLLH